MTLENNSGLEERARTALDQRAASLDAHTLSRLRRARARAVQQRPGWKEWLHLPSWVSAGGLAAATVATLLFSIWLIPPGETDIPETGLADLEILASGDELELYDDLEFYHWLETKSATEPEFDKPA